MVKIHDVTGMHHQYAADGREKPMTNRKANSSSYLHVQYKAKTDSGLTLLSKLMSISQNSWKARPLSLPITCRIVLASSLSGRELARRSIRTARGMAMKFEIILAGSRGQVHAHAQQDTSGLGLNKEFAPSFGGKSGWHTR